jgi:hypothetical protein
LTKKEFELRNNKLVQFRSRIAPLSASTAVIVAILFFLIGGVPGPTRVSAQAKHGFGFNTTNISGFPTGAATLTGGGAYVPGTTFAQSGGAFKCTATILQGPLNGCLAGQGIRWDTAALLPSTTFKCTGAATEPLKTATTSGNTVVLMADFYRQGDGNEESFTGKIIVSEADLDPVTPGIQSVWIQQVGCGAGTTNFD